VAGTVDAARPVALLADLPVPRDTSFDVEELAGGLTNRNHRVHTVSGNRYVARFGAARIDLLGIDRDAEAHNSRVAADIGVGRGVVEYDSVNGILLVDWIDGRTFTDVDLDEPANLSRVAETCRALHAGPRFYGDFDMFDVQRRHLTMVQEHGFRLPDGYLDFAPQVRSFETALHGCSDATVACHNDLLAANMMDDGDRVRFIDDEHSGNNDACFELGNIWSEAGLPEDRLEHLVTSYYGAPSRRRTVRARLWALMSKYGWALWAAIQDAVGQVEFGFWQWGMEKYARAVAEFRNPDFDELIQTVSEPPTHEGAQPWPR
jgi:thiamine kinase-like enzyme